MNHRLFYSCHADTVLYAAYHLRGEAVTDMPGCVLHSHVQWHWYTENQLVGNKSHGYIPVSTASVLHIIIVLLLEINILSVSLLFVWKVHDDIEHLIYYHYSRSNTMYNLDTMNSRSVKSINSFLNPQFSPTICGSPASSVPSESFEKSPMCHWDAGVSKAYKTVALKSVQTLFHSQFM